MMGIIRKLGVNEESPKGCSRMVIVRKKNGDPRGCVDLKRFNSLVPRQAFPADPPFNIVSRIPEHVFKTILDASMGYHSVMLMEEAQSFLHFITA